MGSNGSGRPTGSETKTNIVIDALIEARAILDREADAEAARMHRRYMEDVAELRAEYQRRKALLDRRYEEDVTYHVRAVQKYQELARTVAARTSCRATPNLAAASLRVQAGQSVWGLAK